MELKVAEDDLGPPFVSQRSSPLQPLHDDLIRQKFDDEAKKSYKYRPTSHLQFFAYKDQLTSLITLQLTTRPNLKARTNTTLPTSIPRTLLLYTFLAILMAFTMPTFLNRLMRPFTTSTRLGLGGGETAPISSPEGAQKATIAAGCFWGVEHMYRKEFKGKGLYDARVGYIGGDTQLPRYRAVCSGQTGRMHTFPFSLSPF